MKAVLLAGGRGNRLYPVTVATNKHLLLVYNKPLIYYPLATLIGAGFREIVLVCDPGQILSFRKLLHDGSQWGINIFYATQNEPKGIAHALLSAEDFVRDEALCLFLGDNILLGHQGSEYLEVQKHNKLSGSCLFLRKVSAPEGFGVVELDSHGQIQSITEKPANATTDLVATGIYFFDRSAIGIARSLNPSARGEIEITALNDYYLARRRLTYKVLPPDSHWFDAGTVSGLWRAAEVVREYEAIENKVAGSPDLAACRKGYISKREVLKRLASYSDSAYAGSVVRSIDLDGQANHD